MGWDSSSRRSRLPADWPKTQKRIMRRDKGQCQWVMEYDSRGRPKRLCLLPATDVDHIVPGDDHRDENLRALCEWHHDRKSSAEGNAAMAKRRREIRQRFRRTEEHPGLL